MHTPDKNSRLRAQSTIEFTTLLILVMAGIILMRPYVIRSIGAHMKAWDDAYYDSMTDPLVPGEGVVPLCGDGVCGPGENIIVCCLDCGDGCGDGVCCEDAGETINTCCEDCPLSLPACGDGYCCEAASETLESCCQDCGEGCGDGYCCVAAGETNPLSCCYADCPDECCPPDSCGNERCEEECDEDHESCCLDCFGPIDMYGNECVFGQPCCGDGVCCQEVGQTIANCPEDCCGPWERHCPNGFCEPECGEDEDNCPDDCALVRMNVSIWRWGGSDWVRCTGPTLIEFPRLGACQAFTYQCWKTYLPPHGWEPLYQEPCEDWQDKWGLPCCCGFSFPGPGGYLLVTWAARLPDDSIEEGEFIMHQPCN